MKATRLLTAVAALVLTAAPLAAQPRADHVVLVSVDGLRPDFYLPGSSWPAPNMQQMARDGAHAEGVRGVFPTVTYPSHTTIVTGALPARHGVYYNRPFEPEGQTGEWYWFESSIQVDTLWDAVRAAGRRTAAISWPVTVGAPIDRFVPETYSLDPNSDRLAPMRDGTTPGLWQELEREATGRLSLRNYGSAYITRDDTTGAMAAYVLETHRPALIALHLITTDSAQHAHGRESDRARRAVAAADRAIGAVRDAADRAGILERTAFVVTGDHGFVDLHTQLMPNVWLAEAGLHGTEPDRGEWRATFHPTGGSAFLHLRDEADAEALNADPGHPGRSARDGAPPVPRRRTRRTRPGRRRPRGAPRPHREPGRQLRLGRLRRRHPAHRRRRARSLPHRLPGDPDRLRRLGFGLRAGPHGPPHGADRHRGPDRDASRCRVREPGRSAAAGGSDPLIDSIRYAVSPRYTFGNWLGRAAISSITR